MTDAIQRRPVSGPASGPAASAALMAARFTAWPPKGAPATVASPVAELGEHGHSRNVLGRHRHEEERDPDAHECGRIEDGRGPDQHRRDVGVSKAGTGDGDQDDGYGQSGGHRPWAREATDHRPHDDHRRGQHRHLGQGADRRQAEVEQYPGEHRPSDGDRDGGDQPAQGRDARDHHHERAREQERPDSGGKPARRRPG
ncbi:hypothetical protein GCM10009609_09990 [Pseudonocardia aurantiaca]